MARLTSVDIPRDVGDFRLVGRKALDSFKQMPERDRFVRGMFAWMGFKQAEVAFERPARAAGETKYPFWKMLGWPSTASSASPRSRCGWRYGAAWRSASFPRCSASTPRPPS